MELRPHDLLRIVSADAIDRADAPGWVAGALQAAPWVVARRGPPLGGRIPVGVRGTGRSERFAAFLAPDAIAACASPEDLAPGRRLWREGAAHPVLRDLLAIAPAMDATGLAWGPAGGAGFQIATGRGVLTEVSDLDLVVRARSRVDLDSLSGVVAAVADVLVRVDIQIETTRGGVALGDLLSDADEILLRAHDGPRLVSRAALLAPAPAC